MDIIDAGSKALRGTYWLEMSSEMVTRTVLRAVFAEMGLTKEVLADCVARCDAPFTANARRLGVWAEAVASVEIN